MRSRSTPILSHLGALGLVAVLATHPAVGEPVRAAERNAKAAAQEVMTGLEPEISQAMQESKTPGLAIGIVVGDEIVYAKGFGVRDTLSGQPVTTRTIFPLGWCSGPFTSMLLGMLVDQGELSWDAPIVEHLPELRLQDAHVREYVSARDFLTQRTGLGAQELVLYQSGLSRRELVSRLGYFEPVSEFRQAFDANAVAFLTAEHLAERLIGSTWEEAIERRIFEPLGMVSSSTGHRRLWESGNAALPHQETDDGKVEPIGLDRSNSLGPFGWINSNVEDLARWLTVYLNEGRRGGLQILQPATVEQMYWPEMPVYWSRRDSFSPTSYGLAWGVNTYRGHHNVRLGGFGEGYEALVSFLPRSRIGVVVLANKGGVVGLLNDLRLTIVDRLLGLEPRDWVRERTASAKRATKPPAAAPRAGGSTAHPLPIYAGTYHHPGYGNLELAELDGRLVMEYNGVKSVLRPWRHDVFHVVPGTVNRRFHGFRIRFITDMDGDVSSLAARFEATARDVVFRHLPRRAENDGEREVQTDPQRDPEAPSPSPN